LPVILGPAGRRAVSVALLLASVLSLTASALGENDRSDPLCPHIVACQYEAPAFTIRVVDQQTGRPLADVHAIASWLVHDRRRGVLMALEAISGPDGQLAFPAWGPIRSAVAGMVDGRDPIISLFRPGYRAKLIHNATPLEQPFTARVHAFEQAGQSFELVPFQGNTVETLTDLRKARDPFEGATVSDFHPASVKRLFVNRLRLVRGEAAHLPQQDRDVELLLWGIDADMKSLGMGGG
jgi:hypothetical protein